MANNQHTPRGKNRGMSVHQELGIILESKVFQKLSLEKNVINKKWSPKLIFLDEIFFEKIQLIFDFENGP